MKKKKGARLVRRVELDLGLVHGWNPKPSGG